MKENKPLAKWVVKEETYFERFRIFDVLKSTRINPRTSVAVDFLLMRGLDWVIVIALTEKNEVVLIEQYRHGSEEITTEIPGGCIEPGENPLDSGLRELREETGFVATSAESLGVIFANPALQGMRCHIFLAKGAKLSSAPTLDPGEDINVLLMPLSEVFEKIRRGEITHSLVVAAFGLFALLERDGQA